MGSARRRLDPRGVVRLVHPFPSVLDGAVVTGIAWLAGAPPTRAILLGGAMTLLQFAIGAVNDVVDAPADAGRKPGKPIPAGLVSPAVAISIAILAGLAGLAIVLPMDPRIALIGLVVLGVGLTYDLRLKGTPWSWLPFAIGIPLLPVFGWLGAAGELPPVFAVVLPIAFVEGAALAIANALVDLERDATAGRSSVASAIGDRRAAGLVVVLQAAVGLAALVTAVVARFGGVSVIAVGAASLVLLTGGEAGRRTDDPRRREWSWRMQALAAAALAVAWLGGAISSVRL
jgi:4-hydroxybenzoate polyprenyltransferase